MTIGDKLQSEFECKRDLIPQNITPIFNNFNEVTIGQSGRIKYDEKSVCPYIFANAKMNQLFFMGMVDSFVSRNLFKFQAIDKNESSFSINSNIASFYMSNYNFAVNENLLSHLVFERLQSITLKGEVQSIDVNVFQSFRNLSGIELKPVNMKNFVHTKWVLALNNYSHVYFQVQEGHSFPDEDFCIFSQWPEVKKSRPKLFSELMSDYVNSYITCNNSNNDMNLSDFKNRIELCRNKPSQSRHYDT
jgi:hypothetical protein